MQKEGRINMEMQSGTCLECNRMRTCIFEIKEELIAVQLKFEKEKEKYAQLKHQTDFALSQKNYNCFKAQFTQNEWTKNITVKEKQTEREISSLKAKSKNQEAAIQSMTKEKEKMKKQSEETMGKQAQEIEALRNASKELSDKLNEKKGICKVLMAKIHSLEVEASNYQEELKKIKSLQENRKKEKTEMRSQAIQADFIENGNIFSSLIEDQLREQLIFEFFEVFLKSFDLGRNQPSLQIFSNNLKAVDTRRMQPYCACFIKCLQLHEGEPTQNSQLSQSQKWILSCLSMQKDRKLDTGSKLVYLFRLSSLFYRILNPIQSSEAMAGPEIIKKMKNELFRAFYSYLFEDQ